MLDSLNEIDHVAFYTSSDAPSPKKMLTIQLVNITETSRPTPQSLIDLNNPAPSYQHGPHLSMLSDCLFEGDLSGSRYSESNILAASDNMVVESLTKMREWTRNDEESSFTEDLLGDAKPLFDRTPDVGLSSASDSDDDEDDNTLLRWAIQKRMVLITSK
ncbi:hypothetical protein KY290_023165 [Solanum tuberosum]|uniref:Uncharacterized protein n=1 Tax=Solanum tuberosum TaxID=4113 RepID=A0ABQ7V6G7_SOLTU|nr:hypothetical protein KY284_022622 [Solanum tuberosum]KAH0683004.1 hypothetical protein KY289_020756 [Solanum tuberosum]KAH0694829.1 hypothetical protein KY285_021926 [Solanum tuberosum]KAH0700722.1 hypothetical protein KY284_014937 [Solanum tuberosum]KAH0759672.1 hypothetical protein KY290_023165 [Solanum tuberosum]